MKTFHKPEWYSTVKSARASSEVLARYFRKLPNSITYPREETALTLGPFYTEMFGCTQDDILGVCRFKDLPRKKISSSAVLSSYEPLNSGTTTLEAQDVDYLIVDDDE